MDNYRCSDHICEGKEIGHDPGSCTIPLSFISFTNESNRYISTIIKQRWCLSLFESRKNYQTVLTEILHKADWDT